MKRKLSEIFPLVILVFCTALVCFFLVSIFWDLFSKGHSAVTLDFLLQFPRKEMTSGGIFPAIMGTVLLTFITTLFAAPFGVGCAIYLSEYAPNNLATKIIRASIRNLSGVPSIIYGLFGLALFVQGLRMGTSLFSSGLTLGLLSLPYMIITAEEALKRVPKSMRESALALGATKFESIRDIVFPLALPGILTGLVLTISRAAGETAPILFTGVAFYINKPSFYLNQEYMALPYHLYMLSTQHQDIDLVRPLAYGTALMLFLVILLMNLSAFLLRYRQTKNG